MKIRMVVEAGFANAAHEEIVEVTEADLEGTTLEEWCEQYLQDMLGNYIETYWEEVK